MKLTPIIQAAINLASKLHFGQLRKVEIDLPYIVHPFSVAWILSNYTNDEDVIVAGLLHDVLEDVEDYHYIDLERDFGGRVADIVKTVSEEKSLKLNWEARKTKYLESVKNGSEEAVLVCAADKIHNLQSIIDSHREHGDALWDNFKAPVDKRLWFYEEAAKIVSERTNSLIASELNQVLDSAKNLTR